MGKIQTVGYRPNLDVLRGELYQLFTVFLASKPIADSASNSHELTKKLLNLHDLEQDILTRLLLSIAVTLRVLDDREDGILEMLSAFCGTVTEDIKSPIDSTVGLTIREACNKIIHAKEIEIDRSDIDTGSHLNPYVYLSGNKRKKTWRASISIVEFIKEGLYGVSLLNDLNLDGA